VSEEKITIVNNVTVVNKQQNNGGCGAGCLIILLAFVALGLFVTYPVVGVIILVIVAIVVALNLRNKYLDKQDDEYLNQKFGPKE
jgi:hypothetical protein